MIAVSGRLENGRFTPYDFIELPSNTDAILVIQDKSQMPQLKRRTGRRSMADKPSFSENGMIEDKDKRIAWLKKMDTLISMSLNEDFPDLQRSTQMRESLNLKD